MRRRRQKGSAQAAAEERLAVAWHVDAAGLLSLATIHMLLLWRAALLRGFLLHSDISYFFEPVRSLAHESLRAGRLPLWSPYMFCGYPLAAEGQVAAFYPVALLISWLLPSPGDINWLIITHLLLAASGSYLLARLLGLRPFAAWWCGLTFSFSGYLFAHLHHVSLVCAASWLPVVILFVERAWRSHALPNAVLAAVAWAASALCGHPQTLFQISLVVIFWVAWRWLESGRRRRGLARRAALTLGVTFALGLGLAAVQLLLTADLAAASPHGERGSLEYVTSYSLLPAHLVGLVLPNREGTPAFNSYTGGNYYWEYVLYIGLLPLALAVVGAARRKAWALAGLAAAGMLLALARGNPLYQVLRFIPGFSDFRAPARHIYLFTFAAALLAGHGWQALAGWRWLAAGRRLVLVGAVAAVLASLDLLWFDRPLAPLSDPRVLTAPNPAAAALNRDPGWWRALIVPPSTIDAKWVPPGGWAVNPDGWVEARLLLPADVPQSYRIRIIDGYAGFTDPTQAPFFNAAYAALRAGDLRLLSLVGTRYLVLPPGLNLPGLESVSAGPFVIHRNPEAFPRAFTTAQALPAATAEQAREKTIQLARAGLLRETAVVDDAAAAIDAHGDPAAALTVEEPRPERVIVRARAERDCLLVLNERHDRGWQARLDGRPVRLAVVDAALMGAVLPRGEHTVEFVYRPRGLIVGRAVSLLSLAALAVLLLVPRLRRRA